jgi:hypothetical protein
MGLLSAKLLNKMASLLRILRESDPVLLPVLAQAWGVKVDSADSDETLKIISKAMSDPARAEMVWDSLDDRQRGALHTLISLGSKMPETKFERLFGTIRLMGTAQIEREQPLKNPASAAEALYYRGLISKGFENAETGTRALIFVPEDLLKVLPTHKTSYDNLEGEGGDEEHLEIEPLVDVTNIRAADTSLVDDMTALLAYLQLHNPLLDGYFLSASDGDNFLPFLLSQNRQRLAFLMGLALSADLIEIQGGRAFPKRAEARRWLAATRSEQVRTLVETWRDSTAYIDLMHVPGLHPELEAGTMHQYSPVVARGAVIDLMAHLLPLNEWWSLGDFVELVREDNADFQRPNGDFDSWYIRNDAGEYLTGIESWDAVEGALLEFFLTGPLHWLGLLDLADEAARFTAYGRAFVRDAAWPTPQEPQDKIEVQPDGTILVSRKIPRIDRFQVARFASWVSAGQVYIYKLDGESIQRASEQGINVGHIMAFLSKALGDIPIPQPVVRLLETWKSGATATVTLEEAIIIRTTAQETMDAIWEASATRRYLGARLGPMAAIVRGDQWEALRDALGEQGIQVEMVSG